MEPPREMSNAEEGPRGVPPRRAWGKSACFVCLAEPVSAAEDENLELEQIVERLPRVVDARRRRLALDGRAGRKERAALSRVLRRDARGHRLHALEAAARVERRALRAGVEVGAAPGAAAVEPDSPSIDGAALGAPDHFAEARHVDVARAVLRNPARAGGRTRLGRGARRSSASAADRGRRPGSRADGICGRS